MEFICVKKFKTANVGEVFEADGHKLTKDGELLCFVASQNSHDFFAKNDDGKGTQRFELTHGIIAKIKGLSEEYEEACAVALEALGEEPSEEAVAEALGAIENKATEALDKAEKAGFLTHGHWNHDFFVATIKKLTALDSAIDSL